MMLSIWAMMEARGSSKSSISPSTVIVMMMMICSRRVKWTKLSKRYLNSKLVSLRSQQTNNYFSLLRNLMKTRRCKKEIPLRLILLISTDLITNPLTIKGLNRWYPQLTNPPSWSLSLKFWMIPTFSKLSMQSKSPKRTLLQVETRTESWRRLSIARQSSNH